MKIKYSVKQSAGINSRTFDVIKGELKPAGYPNGIEGKDWVYFARGLSIRRASAICRLLNK